MNLTGNRFCDCCWPLVQPRIASRSGKSARNSTSAHGPLALRVDHELQQVTVRIADVYAGGGLLSPALPRNRTFNDLCPGAVEHRLKRFGRSIPDEAQVAARRLSSGSPQRECFALPRRRTMKIDHLTADVYRTCRRVLAHLQSQPAIERQHRVSVLHGESDVIEPTDATGRLRQPARSGRGNRRSANESPSRNTSRLSHALNSRRTSNSTGKGDSKRDRLKSAKV